MKPELKSQCLGNGGDNLNPDIEQWFQRHVLAVVIAEDYLDPRWEKRCDEAYVQELAGKLLPTFPQMTLELEYAVSTKDLAEVSIATAREVVEIRKLTRKIFENCPPLDELEANPLYQTYREFFDRSPEVLLQIHQIEQAMGLARHGM